MKNFDLSGPRYKRSVGELSKALALGLFILTHAATNYRPIKKIVDKGHLSGVNLALMNRVAIFLCFLGMMSCGNKDNSTGDPPPRSNIVYQRALELTSSLEDSRNHLIIKDKALYRFAQGKNLEGSFALGDDYRLSLKKTFAEHIGTDAVAIPYTVSPLSLSSFENINITLGKFDFERESPVSEVLALQDIREPLTLEKGRFVGRLSVDKNRLENSEPYFLGIANFVEDGQDSLIRQQELHQNNARLYIATSKGEQVLLYSPRSLYCQISPRSVWHGHSIRTRHP